MHPSFAACDDDMLHYHMVYLFIVHSELSSLIKIQVFTIPTLKSLGSTFIKMFKAIFKIAIGVGHGREFGQGICP